MKEKISEMIFEHDHELLRIVYIEYQGRQVFSVVCDGKEVDGAWCGYIRNFDFEKDCKGIEKFMFYHSGSGGKITEINAPHYVEGSNASYWMHPDARYKGRPKNIIRRKTPIKYKGEANPFNHGREIYGQDYCKFCEKWYDQDACPDHHVINENGELEYMDGSKADE